MRNCAGRHGALWVCNPVVVAVTDVVEDTHDQQVGEQGHGDYPQHRYRAGRNPFPSERGE